MLAHQTNDKSRRPFSRIAASLVLLLTGLWVFDGTIDGPSVRFGSKSSYEVYKTPKLVDGTLNPIAWPLWVGVFSQSPPPVHASFLLFDVKQNLRRWPNVAGDISRSPPFFLAV